MQVNIGRRKLKDGRESLYLDINKNGKRSREALNLYLVPRSSKNKETLNYAKRIAVLKYEELINDEYGFSSNQKKNASFINYFINKNPDKMNISIYYSTLKHLKKFCSGDVKFKHIDKTWLESFINYLTDETRLNQNSVYNYYSKTKEILFQASREGYIKEEIIKHVKNPKRNKTERGYLEIREVKKLVNTPYNKPNIAEAFLFSCFTGLRQSDIRNLQWGDIVESKIKLKQQKTKEPVVIELNSYAKSIIERDGITYLPNVKIFNLPKDRSQINYHLDKWFKIAGINKKAFYHLSRHTFATLLLTRGNDIYTTSKLLGHQSVKTTERYANLVEEKRVEAINSLPDIKELEF